VKLNKEKEVGMEWNGTMELYFISLRHCEYSQIIYMTVIQRVK